jgi:short-subunit dehydrogenase
MSLDECPRIAVVTGASSGLGEGLAVALAREGWTVGLLARREGELLRVRDRIREGGGGAATYPCDVSDRVAVEAALDRCRDELGPPELLVCNAGISEVTPARDLDAAMVARLMEVNFLGAVWPTAHLLPEMLARGRGHLVGVGSLAGYGGLSGSAAYSASKGAVHHFFESLRIDLRGSGVDVTVLTPGYVRTPLTDRNAHPMPFLMELDDAVEAMLGAIGRRERLLAFPFPLSTLLRVAQLLPRALRDRLAARHRREKTGGARSP